MSAVSGFLEDAENLLDSVTDYDDVTRSLEIIERVKSKLARRQAELRKRSFKVLVTVHVHVSYEVEARSEREAEREFRELFAYHSALSPIDRDLEIMEEIVDEVCVEEDD